MSDEPPKLIEAHLEALAAQRRQAAGGVFEMGEAAKRTLLGEVERVHGLIETPAPSEAGAFVPFMPAAIEAAPEPVAATVPDEAEALRLALQAEVQRMDEPVKTAALEEAEGPSAWRMLWMRLAFSFGTVAVIGLAAFIIRLQIPPERDGQSFAKLSQASADKTIAVNADAEATRSNLLAASSKSADSLGRLDRSQPLATALAVNDPAGPMPSIAPATRSLVRPEPAQVERQLSASALNEKAKDLSPVPAPAIPAAPVPAQPQPESTAKKMALTESRTTEARQLPEPAKAERRAAAPQPVGAASATAAIPTTAGVLGGAAVPPELSESLFVQREVPSGMRRNFQSPPKPDVLTTFRLVPQGDTVRLIDQDGSVYLGKRTSSGSPLRFSATGNNVTLGQPVSVEATLIPGTNGAPAVLRGQVRAGARRSWQFEAEGR